MRKPEITAFPLAPITAPYPSHAYYGLCELHNSNTIKLRLGVSPPFLSVPEIVEQYKLFARIAYFEIRSPDRKRIIIDFGDGHRLANEKLLEHCDFYFKRCFSPDGYPDTKIQPYGLHYDTTPQPLHFLAKRSFFCIANRRDWISNPKQVLKLLKQGFWYQRNQPKIPHLLSSSGEVKVGFQTRLLDPSIRHHKDRNEQRIDLVRSLKHELGDNYVGGIVRTEHSENVGVNELLTSQASDREGYYKLIENTAIWISTTGVGTSTPWKIAEFLGFGRCIITNPILDKLPEPLGDGEQIAVFETTKECIDQATRLLQNHRARDSMQQSAHRYFHEHASPEMSLKKLISSALGYDI